jgi:hypothetical protein
MGWDGRWLVRDSFTVERRCVGVESLCAVVGRWLVLEGDSVH